ncbi:MAG TPA: N-acetyltransferase, partial [Polyangiaceae bacterium]
MIQEAALVDAFRTASRLAFSLVAVEREQVVGHVAFSPVTINGEPGPLGLAPLAVRSGRRRRGIAAELVREGLELCQAAGTGLVVVLGDPRYYARFGFELARRYALRDEYEG